METLKTAKFREWMQPLYLREVAEKLRHWIDLCNTDRMCAGVKKLKTRPLENQEVIDHLSDVYFELSLKKRIQMDFQQFLLEVQFRYDYGHANGLRNDFIHRSRWDVTNCEFRGHTKYVKNADHKPKEKKDESWHEYIGHKKDKSKHGRWYRSAKKYIINKEERSYRRWVKAQIKHENYDALGDDWSQDSYIWD